MPAIFRAYNPAPLFGADYTALRDFLIRLDSPSFHFGRWDWMITHGWLDASGLPKIGLWTDGGEVVAAAMYDCELGDAFPLALPGYESLYGEIIRYAQDALAKDGKCGMMIPDGNLPLQSAAMRQGYTASQDRDFDAVFPLDHGDFSYTLPEGFRVTSMEETYDLFNYGRVLWKGFNHELNGEGPFVFSDRFAREFERPNVNRFLKIAVAAPNGEFVSYCGMWHDPRSRSVLVEPVATDPAHRKMGLGRAAVLEALRRCAALGAARAYVGSSQQFYYNIGFRPHASSTLWKKR